MKIIMEKESKIKELIKLRNIGMKTAERLYEIGITNCQQLQNANPEKVYEKLRMKEVGKLDKCVLYQIQGAILTIPWWECKNLTPKQ